MSGLDEDRVMRGVNLIPDNLPEDVEAERSLVATCCAPGCEMIAAELAAELSAENFVHPVHRKIWAAMTEVLQDRTEINALTLKACLERRGALDLVGGYPGLIEVLSAEEVGRPKVLAAIVREKKQRRDLMKVGHWLLNSACEADTDVQDLINKASEELLRLSGVGIETDLRPYGEIVDESLKALLQRLEGKSILGVKVGSPRLDDITGGFQPGNLVLLAARPGVGKTALALNWSIYSALRLNRRIAFFSLEMSNHEIGQRGLSIVSSVGPKELEASRGDERLLAQVFTARDDLREAPIWVCDQANITVPQMHALCRKAATRPGEAFDMVVVDYLQLIESPAGSRAARQSEAVRIGEISRAFKLMAKDLGVPVIVLSQLNREVEKRTGNRPQLSDLRDSGALEQDADTVCFIHRRMNPTADGEPPDPLAELIIAKHRSGPTGMVPLYFEGSTNRYREYERMTSP